MSKITSRGVNLPSLKEPAASRPIAAMPAPSYVLIPIFDEPLAAEGEKVVYGDALCTGVFSSVSGTLEEYRSMLHPVFGSVTCASVKVRDDSPAPNRGNTTKTTDKFTSFDIIAAARNAGIIDELDGESLADKLERITELFPGSGVHMVADASEQEPYSSSAWTVLHESSRQVYEGLTLAARAGGLTYFYISVHLPAHRRRLLSAQLPASVFHVQGKYPAPVSRRSAPALRIGVQACLALYHAVTSEKKQTDIVVTVAGDAVATPQNVRVPIGTPVREVLRFCGLSSDPSYIILGDALTGTSIPDDDFPIAQGISCLIAMTDRKIVKVRGCIGCGLCVKACHASLLPNEIARRMDNMQYERIPQLLAENCDGCGACSFVCPSGLDVAVKVGEAKDTHGNILLKWGEDNEI